ncbi:MAG: methylenetetrahydrofolate reductase [NAD(P)H] [Elusimicrobiales bacterium]|nr:methylenetetrahydrofolate reductase [NAD(P)H] [Elusimicrobiales bacterium]MCK5106105.1 methylenetetrahydrofolate reductase [NAD(P)H] [Elusimicrobiales bacterium]MCK5583230.1 methylenetetrahydrofolate reductase [NAD(P)H] [Elusimicrobiales bacterium]
MKITERLKDKRKIFSFEFYPPKTEKDTARLYSTIEDLQDLNPDFVSITNSSTGIVPHRTTGLSKALKEKTPFEIMVHLTCVSHTRKEIREIVSQLKEIGIDNILALRGDIPDEKEFKINSDYTYACELVEDLRTMGDFSIGVAAYPEKHPEAASLKEDILNLKKKVDAGADFAITQLFFDNKSYFNFMDKCAQMNVNIPIIPGIMPITNYKQLSKFTQMIGVAIPKELAENIEKYLDDKESLMQFGIDYAVNQSLQLLEYGAKGIHFYTLNRSKATKQILKTIMKHSEIKN